MGKGGGRDAQKALKLDPTLGEAYNCLATVNLYYYRNWPEAEGDFRRGLELSPNFAEMHAHYASLVFFGRNDEALSEVERALALDPLSPRFGFTSGKLRFFMRQYDTAIEQYRKTLELDPNLPFAHESLGDAYEKKGMQKEAIAEWVNALTLTGERRGGHPSTDLRNVGFRRRRPQIGGEETRGLKCENRSRRVRPGSGVRENLYSIG